MPDKRQPLNLYLHPWPTANALLQERPRLCCHSTLRALHLRRHLRPHRRPRYGHLDGGLGDSAAPPRPPGVVPLPRGPSLLGPQPLPDPARSAGLILRAIWTGRRNRITKIPQNIGDDTTSKNRLQIQEFARNFTIYFAIYLYYLFNRNAWRPCTG